MNSKHKKTLEAIFAVPTLKTVEWNRIEALFIALGAETIEGRGSRVRFVINNTVGAFHRPHPSKDANPYQVEDARSFLLAAGVKE